jgi:SPX domain protein involved in polyphosphate accumulation
MIRDDSFDRERAAGNWRRQDVKDGYPFKSLPKEECSIFPFAVLEINYTLAGGMDDPIWMKELMLSGMLEPVPRFSKFVHGAAALLEDRVPLLPNWLVGSKYRRWRKDFLFLNLATRL